MEKRPRPIFFTIPLAKNDDADGDMDNIELFREGEYQTGWPGETHYSSQEDVKSLKKSFDQGATGTSVSVYYSHWSNDRKAAGEVKKVMVKKCDDGRACLWGKIDWTPAGRQAIQDREYKYVSIEMIKDGVHLDPMTGKKKKYDMLLTGVALTNQPVINDLKKLFSIHGVDPLKFNTDPKVEDKNKENPMDTKLAALLGITEESQLFRKVEELVNLAKNNNDALKESREREAKLKQEMEDFKKAQFSKEKEAVLKPLFDSNKITKGDYESYMEFDESQFKVARIFLAKLGESKGGALPKVHGNDSQTGLSPKEEADNVTSLDTFLKDKDGYKNNMEKIS